MHRYLEGYQYTRRHLLIFVCCVTFVLAECDEEQKTLTELYANLCWKNNLKLSKM